MLHFPEHRGLSWLHVNTDESSRIYVVLRLFNESELFLVAASIISRAKTTEIDAHQDEFVKVLKEAVAIASVSSDPERRSDCVKMVMWTKK
ncbi:hypothetical protein ANCDUO_22299, partial [Ancylostoma duodenale]